MEGSNKMFKLSVDFGENSLRTVMTNIGNKPGLSEENEAEDSLTGTQFPFITNLKPAKIMGIESEAMIMVVESNGIIEGVGSTEYTSGASLL